LLAHELTHVVQQGAAPAAGTRASARASGAPAPARTGTPLLQRAPLDGDDPSAVRQRGGTLPYREATELNTCIRIMGEANAAYCRQQVLGEQPQPTPPPESCDPTTPLTWADFQGTPPGGPFAAETHFHHDLVTEQGRQVVRAFFEPGTSWVRPRSVDPTNRAVNGCGPQVTACQQFFDSLSPGQTGTRWLTPGAGCAASPAPNPAIIAHSRGDCDSLLGAECDRVAQLDSERLLRHEQLHFDIACVLARRGSDAVFIRPANQAQTILTAVRTKANAQTVLYDNQTNHGCNAGPQATWETNVRNQLPAVTIP
jgi:hypothetical protein